jgi:hypothetical protein
MFTERLSVYTQAELEELFSSHPFLDDLDAIDKRRIFEMAASDVRSKFVMTEQIQNSNISNNKFTYSGVNDDILGPELSDNERDNLRLSTYTFQLIDENLKGNKYLKGLSETQRLLIYAIAQHEFNRLVNNNKAADYPLWYSPGAVAGGAPVERTSDMPFSTAFTITTVDQKTNNKDMPFSTAVQTVVGGLVSQPVKDLVFSTGITVIVDSSIRKILKSSDMPFSTTFTATTSGTASLKIESEDMAFSTTFVAAVKAQTLTNSDMPFSTTFTTSVA